MKPLSNPLTVQKIEQITQALPAYTPLLTMADYEQGLLGVSLYYCFYARYSGDDSYFTQAEKHFDEAMTLMGPDHFVKRFKQDYVCNEYLSLGRYLEYCLKHHFLEMDTNHFLGNTDELISDHLQRRSKVGDLDLFGGVLHAGHYFYARMNSSPSVRSQLEQVIDCIDSWARYDSQGGAYWQSPTLKNAVYLGLSHGSGMILAFLAAMHEAGIRTQQTRRLLQAGSQFVLSQQRSHPLGLFPLIAGDAVEAKQFSQCYGDLGTAFGLFRASQVLTEDFALAQRVDDILSQCCQRSIADGCTPDATITYGAAGLAAVFDDLYRRSGHIRYQAAAQDWYSQIMSYDQGGPYAGFHNRFSSESNEFMQISLGWGITGIGISLMQYVRKDLPTLDGLLMTI